MRVILSGPVTLEDIEAAELMEGIVPTQFISNGKDPLPDVDLFYDVRPAVIMPLDPKIAGIYGELRNNYPMVQIADAIIIHGRNIHLVKLAGQYNLPYYVA